MTTSAPATSPATEPTKKRRKWPWITLATVIGVLVLALAGGVFYFSNLLGDRIKIQSRTDVNSLTVTAADGDRVSYSIDEDDTSWNDLGFMGLDMADDGWFLTEDPTGTDPATRTVTEQSNPPALEPGERGRLDGNYFFDNPQAGMGLSYSTVKYSSPAGEFDAWLVPGDPNQKTWVIFTHGLNASPREGLRTLDTTHRLGYTTMLINYRNDIGQPQTDGYVSFGGDEWEDLEGAVRYALDNGAEQVFLVGNSHGGAVTLSFLLNSDLAAQVPGVFLDGPASNFSKIVDDAAADLGAPGPITALAKAVSEPRFGIDWGTTDYTARAGDFTTPMTIVQGTADTTVPPEVNQEFAAAVNAATPGLIDLQMFPDAPHTTEWNVDRPRFESILTGALQKAAG